MKLRVGVIGTGFGSQVQIPAFQAHPRAEVVAVASGTPGKAAQVAARFGIPQAFDRYEDLVRTDLDLVSITPQPVVHETPVPAVEEKGRISSRQLGMLRKLVNEKLDGDWNAFDSSCKQRFGRATAYLTTKEASSLISELIRGNNNGNHTRTAAR